MFRTTPTTTTPTTPSQICTRLLYFYLHPICISICAIYLFVFVLALYMYFFVYGGQKGPHLVAEGHQPSAGVRSLAHIGGQIF